MKIFFDTEFTGLHQNTTLISIGLISEDDKTFYAEFTDYDKSQVDNWIKENVINKLYLTDYDIDRDYKPYEKDVKISGDSELILHSLSHWLDQFDKIEMVADVLSYDWVLFCNIFGGSLNIPSNIHYIPIDISTIFIMNNIDSDIDREKFALGEVYYEMLAKKHTALWDANITKLSYEKLMKIF